MSVSLSWFLVTDNSKKHSLSYSEEFSKFESNTPSDCLKQKSHDLTLPKQALVFTFVQYKSSESTLGKRRNSPFPTVLPTFLENFLPFLPNVELSSGNSFGLEES